MAKKEIVASVTERGQVTIPAEVRRLLNLRGRGKVSFAIDGDHVSIAPSKYTWETAFASVPPLDPPKDFDQSIREAKEERAERLVERMRKGLA
jgi:AbrB family looped-hinge helix DNA binding protein